MPDQDLTDLVEHLSRIAALSEAQSRLVIEEVLAFFNEDIESFIRRRHREMQHQGLSNARIFAAIQGELFERLFPAEPLTERKIRRVIYG